MTQPVRIKTFRTRTREQALELIQREFGASASILETKQTHGGLFRRSRIEITASNSRLEQSEPIAENVTNAEHIDVRGFSATNLASNDSGSGDATERSDSPVQPPSIESHHQQRVCSQVLNELLESGIESTIAQQWIAAASCINNASVLKDAWSLRAELIRWIRDLVHAAPPLELGGGTKQTISFVGPTGAGKTTTLAKIAANLSMEHSMKVGVLQTSSRQPGDQVLLRQYADLLGWNIQSPQVVDQLDESLAQFEGCDCVLVDTPGCTPSDTETLQQIEEWHAVIQPTMVHLVIPSTVSPRSFMRYEEGFDCLEPSTLLLTKLDESLGLGPLFSCIQNCSLPVSYMTHGQKIPVDIQQATTQRIAQNIFMV